MLKLVDDYLIKCLEEEKISQAELERSESIAKTIIFSYTIAVLVVLILNSLANFFVVSTLEKWMKFYTEQKIERESFIPLPFFGGSDVNTSVTEISDLENSSNINE